MVICRSVKGEEKDYSNIYLLAIAFYLYYERFFLADKRDL